MSMPKIVCVVGPTSSGKSELAVVLAKKFGGEIISADSRQVYKGMDLGTGKVGGKWTRLPKNRDKVFLYKGIPHYLIDFRSPTKQYSASLFQKQADKSIKDILKRGRLPIICGGTGQWMDAVAMGQQLPDVKPDLKLRRRLESNTAEELFKELKKLDPARAGAIDRHNKRRLVRALEIIKTTGKPVPTLASRNIYKVLWLGIGWPQDVLDKRIKKRLKERLDLGMVREVKRLRRQGLSFKRLMDFGLEYKYISLYLQKKLFYNEMFDQLFSSIRHYSKRQMTWWKRNKDILWIKEAKKASREVEFFLK